jgi:hypothetical protein
MEVVMTVDLFKRAALALGYNVGWLDRAPNNTMDLREGLPSSTDVMVVAYRVVDGEDLVYGAFYIDDEEEGSTRFAIGSRGWRIFDKESGPGILSDLAYNDFIVWVIG